MHIVILDDYQDAVRHLDCFAMLSGHQVTITNRPAANMDELVGWLAPAEAVVLIRERTPITAGLLERLPGLRLISQTGKGTAHIDHDACARHGVEVRTGGGEPYAPAELTWALALAAMRRLPQEMARLRAGNWQGDIGLVMRGRTLGIWGYGQIGALVAGYGRAFAMRVLVWGREGSLARAAAEGYELAASREELLAQADVLSLHVKLTAETGGLVTAADLAQMKPTAVLVNTSRAGLIVPGALYEALRAGRPGMAAVDVFDDEPIWDPSAEPLLGLPNVIATPHIGYVEKDSYELYFGQAFANVLTYADQTGA
jgi:D-3-phosphoglycerate dehydrogenase